MNEKQHIYSIRKKQYKHAKEYLTAKQVERLFQAGEKAYEIEAPLNRFFTIHYDDYADKNRPQKFVTQFLENARKWLQRRNIKVAYLYVIENGKDKGLHTHLLIHIPEGYQVAFKRAVRNWLPFEWDRARVNVGRINYPPYGALHPLNPLYGRIKYICKGIHPTEKIKGIRPIYQGRIMGRRYGISKALNGAPYT